MHNLRICFIVGELLTSEDREQLVQDLYQGLVTSPANVLEVLKEELLQTPEKWEHSAIDGGGTLLHRETTHLELSVAYRPSVIGLSTVITGLLAPPKTDELFDVVVIYGGLLADGSGHWLLPSYDFKPEDLSEILKSILSTNGKTGDNPSHNQHIQIHIAMGGLRSGGDWRQLTTRPLGLMNDHPVQVSVNNPPVPKPTGVATVNNSSSPEMPVLHTLIEDILHEVPSPLCLILENDLTPRSPQSPALHVCRPCLYIFPEGSGQSTIFTLPGYNMLIDAGCSHRPTFWPVANHLNHIDTVMLTHWGVNNVLGLCATLPTILKSSQSESDINDKVTCLLTPPPDIAAINSLPEINSARSSLCLSLPRQILSFIGQMKERSGRNMVFHQLCRGTKLSTPTQCINLYKKVGQGTLDLYALTPSTDDSAELRKLTDDWSKASSSLVTSTVPLGRLPPANKFAVPLLSHLSMSALLVWRPSMDSEPILRLLLVSPNAHQTRVLLSLDAMVSANIWLRHARAVPVLHEKRPSTNSIPSTRDTSTGSNRPSTAGRSANQNRTTDNKNGNTDASAHALIPNSSSKAPPYDKVKPIYVDVCYVPGGGNTRFVDVEWFKRVRARYYVVTYPKPSSQLMEAIVAGKESWTGEDVKLAASIVFAHESEDILIWLGRNSKRLASCQLDVSAIASRSSIQLTSDLMTTAETNQPVACTGYRIDL